MKFGHIILRKIIKFVVTKCQTLRSSIREDYYSVAIDNGAPNSISAGALPQTGGAYSAPQVPS